LQSIPIGNGPQGVAVGGGSVWVANTPDGTVTRFDPGNGRIRKLAVGEAPTGVAYGDGGPWVASSGSGKVMRSIRRAGSVRSVETGNEPTAVAAVGGDAWMTVLPGSASHRGGTLRLALPRDAIPSSPDPTSFSGVSQWQLLSLTNDGLLTYRRAGGLAGAELVPDLATAIPQPARRRPDVHLPPSGRHPLLERAARPAEDIRRGIGRVMRSANPYLTTQYAGIIGGDRCQRQPRDCDLTRGIVTDREAGTVVFHLVRPDPDFLYKLAFAMASAVPAGTPTGDLGRRALPATGPYMTRAFSSRAFVGARAEPALPRVVA
jgi:hypothetical protein